MAADWIRHAKEGFGCLAVLLVAATLLVGFLVATRDMSGLESGALVVGPVLALIATWQVIHWRRGRFIRTAPLPVGLYDAMRKAYPHLARKDCELAAHALRHFFLAYRHGGYRFVAMPSQAADVLWHAFILHTRSYATFCRRAFGRTLHHTPAAAMGRQRDVNAGLRRCWWQACKEENIDPRAPTRLPLLFALDAKLAIPDGFTYALNCHGLAGARDRGDGAPSAGTTQCANDFGDSSIDGSTDGFGDGDGSGGGDGGDGGGDGGGCGGGD